MKKEGSKSSCNGAVYVYVIEVFILLIVISIVAFIWFYVPSDNNDVDNITISDDSSYLIYIDGHPELTIKFITYNTIKMSNIAYNVGTRVIYVVSPDGDVFPLYNSDGTLMLYEENDEPIAVIKQ